MDAPIVSRETIARLADHAAAKWVADPGGRKPGNPFDPILQSEHHSEWNASFERHLLRRSAPEAEGSA